MSTKPPNEKVEAANPADRQSPDSSHAQANTPQDQNSADPNLKKGPPIKHGIADADKIARSGTTDERVRNTPPAGAWNDTSSD